jgi:hypothetical protein
MTGTMDVPRKRRIDKIPQRAATTRNDVMVDRVRLLAVAVQRYGSLGNVGRCNNLVNDQKYRRQRDCQMRESEVRRTSNIVRRLDNSTTYL